MLVVSKISVHPRKKRMYQVELSEPENSEQIKVIDLHEDLIVKHELRKGLPFPDAKLRELINDTEAHQVYQSALNYISYRMRSKKEVQTHLKNKAFSSGQIERVINRMEEENWLNDQAFAEAYVRSKKSVTSKGPSVIRQELFSKGISEALVDGALSQYTVKDERAQAQKFAEKKQRGWLDRSIQEQRRKVSQALLQKGFSPDVANEVVQQLEVAQDEETEWRALVKQGQKALDKYKAQEGYTRKMKIKQFLYRKGFQMDLIEKWMKQVEEQQ